MGTPLFGVFLMRVPLMVALQKEAFVIAVLPVGFHLMELPLKGVMGFPRKGVPGVDGFPTEVLPTYFSHSDKNNPKFMVEGNF